MSNVYAFIDEAGAFGFDFSKENVSTHFIISAIIVEEKYLDELTDELSEIRRRYFSNGEMKSSTLSKNYSRRKRLLEELVKLPFHVFAIVVNKKALDKDKQRGLQYRSSFYKFLNNIVYKAISNTYKDISIIADNLLSKRFMSSFEKYIDEKKPLTFFGGYEFSFQDSKSNVCIQLADVISGTLLHIYDEQKKNDFTREFKDILIRSNRVMKLENYPINYKNYSAELTNTHNDYDELIAKISIERVATYIDKNRDSEDEIIMDRVAVLNHLLFELLNIDDQFISTTDLMRKTSCSYTKQTFRINIIAHLRDEGILIASQLNGGYKIPTSEADLYHYLDTCATKFFPMIERVKKCRDTILLATHSEVDLFDKAEYHELKLYLDTRNDDVNQMKNN